MPIKRLEVEKAFPRLGKLKKGGEKVTKKNKNGKEYEVMGPELPYFRFISDREELVDVFSDAYGEQPAMLKVYLPYESVDRNFEYWQEKWDASGLSHRCDGETMIIWRDGDKYYRGEKPCPYFGVRDQMTEKELKESPPCTSRGRLNVLLPELIRAGYVGFVTIETGGEHDIMHIQKVLKAAYDERQDLRGIEFTVRRQLENISTPGWGDRKGQRSRADKWNIKIEPSPTWVLLQIEMANRQQMNGLLPATTTPMTTEHGEHEVAEGVLVDPEDDWKEGDEVTETEPEPEKKADEPSPNGGEDLRPKTATDWQSFYNYSNTIISYEEGAAIAKETKDAQVAYDKVKEMSERATSGKK